MLRYVPDMKIYELSSTKLTLIEPCDFSPCSEPTYGEATVSCEFPAPSQPENFQCNYECVADTSEESFTFIDENDHSKGCVGKAIIG